MNSYGTCRFRWMVAPLWILTNPGYASEPTEEATEVPPAEVEASEGWYADQRGTTVQFFAGASLKSWAGVPVRTAAAHFASGGKTSAGAFTGRAFLERGHTEQGLPAGSVGLGFDWMAPIQPRFHLGAGLQMGLLTYQRATTGNPNVIGMTGLRAAGMVDVTQGGPFDLVFQVRGGPNIGMGPGYWDVMASLGLVFRIDDE